MTPHKNGSLGYPGKGGVKIRLKMNKLLHNIRQRKALKRVRREKCVFKGKKPLNGGIEVSIDVLDRKDVFMRDLLAMLSIAGDFLPGDLEVLKSLSCKNKISSITFKL